MRRRARLYWNGLEGAFDSLFFGEEARLLEIVCDHILPQDDRDLAHRIPIVPYIDKRLTRSETMGIASRICHLMEMRTGWVFRLLIKWRVSYSIANFSS